MCRSSYLLFAFSRCDRQEVRSCECFILAAISDIPASVMLEACKASSIFPKSFSTVTSCSPSGLSKATSFVLLRLEFQGNKMRPGPMRLLCGSTPLQNRALLTIRAYHESLCSWKEKPLVVLRWNFVNQCTRFLLSISALNIGISEQPCTREAANHVQRMLRGKENPHL